MVSIFSYTLDISPNKFHPDLKIFVDDSKSEIIAHRAVLACHSRLLKTLFMSSDVEGEAVLILPDFSMDDVNQMLLLLYGQISELNQNDLFSMLGLSPTYQESGSFVDNEESELMFETFESEIILDPLKRPRSRSKPAVFTDATTNLVLDPDYESNAAANIDVDAYIIQEPAALRPWVCQVCLVTNTGKNPYRAMYKHNLHYHIIRKHFNMEIPKNWQCDLCSKKFISRSGLRQHKRDKCPRSSRPESRTSHHQMSRTPTPTPGEEPESDAESAAAGGTRMFKCGTCHNIFESIVEINTHMRYCKEEEQVIYQCKEEEQEQVMFQYNAKEEEQAMYQYNAKEEEQVMYQCNECWEAGQEFIFPSMLELNSHMASEHNDVNTSSSNLEQKYIPSDDNLQHTANPPETVLFKDVESVPHEVKEDSKDERDAILNAPVIIDDGIVEDIANRNVEQTTGDSVLIEGVVESKSHVLFDDYESPSVENPDIDTNEVLVHCETSGVQDENSNEISLEMVDENDNPVFCPVCNNGFSSPEVLTEHLTHHPSCPTCGEMVLSQAALAQHIATHYMCGVCGDRFAELEVLEKHEQNHADIEQAIRGESVIVGLKYQNPEIRDAISSIQAVPVIVNNEVAVPVIVNNDDVDEGKSDELIPKANLKINYFESSEDISSLLVQQNIHAQCDLCEKNFLSEAELDVHILSAHADKESPQFQLQILEPRMNCNFCQETFISVSELNAHTAGSHTEILEAVQRSPVVHQDNSQEQVAVRENVQPFNCTLCKDTFAKIGQLNKHIINDHKINKLDSGKPFLCTICSSNFLQLSTLEKHVTVQHKNQEHSFQCPECNKTFKHSAGLQSHLRIHNSIRLFQCGACTRTFNWEASLRTHLKKCGGEPFKEHVPKKKLATKPEVNIEVGLGAESVVMTVKCSRCGENFGDQDLFSSHTCPGSMGRGRRYRCNKCNLLFRSRKMIRRHLRSCAENMKQEDGTADEAEQRLSKRKRKVVKDDLFVTDLGSDKELDDLVDSDAEEEFKLNAKDVRESSDDSEGSSGDELDDFTIEPSIKRYKIESKPKSIEINTKEDGSHQLQKNFPCEFCDKVFKRWGHLKEHKMGHTNEYPFNCEDCGRGFKRRLALEKHNCSDPVRKPRVVPNIHEASHEDPHNTIESKCETNIAEKTTYVITPCLFNCNVCKFSTNDGQSLNQHLQSKEHTEMAAYEEFASSGARFKCDLCFYAVDSEYKFKRHMATKKHLENEENKTEEELEEKLKNPKIYSCLICNESFKDMGGLDEHVEIHNEELTSRSGRKLKPKKFYDDLSVDSNKRKLDEEGNRAKVKRIKPDTSQENLSGSGVECGICGETFISCTDQFIHMLSHVPPEIVKTLPGVDEGGVGWCPHCPGPVRLENVEDHMAEMHGDMEDQESDHGLKIGEKRLEFDEIDPEELESLEVAESARCVAKRLPG